MPRSKTTPPLYDSRIIVLFPKADREAVYKRVKLERTSASVWIRGLVLRELKNGGAQ